MLTSNDLRGCSISSTAHPILPKFNAVWSVYDYQGMLIVSTFDGSKKKGRIDDTVIKIMEKQIATNRDGKSNF